MVKKTTMALTIVAVWTVYKMPRPEAVETDEDWSLSAIYTISREELYGGRPW